jgi:hypothetical protein
MAVKTEKPHAGEFLVSEANGYRSREEVTFASGTPALEAGEIVAKLDSGGKWTAFDEDASNGSETGLGVLYAAVDASAADAQGVVIVRDAEVKGELLTVQDGETLSVAKADLAAVGIILR